MNLTRITRPRDTKEMNSSGHLIENRIRINSPLARPALEGTVDGQARRLLTGVIEVRDGSSEVVSYCIWPPIIIEALLSVDHQSYDHPSYKRAPPLTEIIVFTLPSLSKNSTQPGFTCCSD